MAEHNAKFVQAVGTTLIGLALSAGVFVGYKAVVANEPARTIIVTGKATREMPSNQSMVTGSWQGAGSTSDEARAKASEGSSRGIEALKGAGIDGKKIRTTQASVYPQYDYSTTGNSPKITGYQAMATLEITLTDAGKASEILALLTKNEASSTSGPSLTLSAQSKDTLEKELKVAAVADAAIQAKALADQAGGTLGKVISIVGGQLNDGGSAPMPSYALSSEGKATDAVGLPDIAVGDQEISVTVSVTYTLR